MDQRKYLIRRDTMEWDWISFSVGVVVGAIALFVIAMISSERDRRRMMKEDRYWRSHL